MLVLEIKILNPKYKIIQQNYYAEASMEMGDFKTASTYISTVRNVAGLPDFTRDIEETLI